VWVGFDDKTSLGKGETGARAALPIWISFMDQALSDTPIEIFKSPEGITLMKVDIETGLPSEGGSKETITEAFVDGTLPGKEGHEKENPSGSTPVRRGFPGDASAPSNY